MVDSEPIINTHAFWGKSKIFKVSRHSAPLFEDPALSESGTMLHTLIAFDARENRDVISVVSRVPKFVGCFSMANPNPDPTIRIPRTKADLPAEIERLLDEPYVVGIKTHPPMFQARIDDGMYDAYCEIAQRLDVPILFHFSSKAQEYTSVSMLENVFQKFPNLKIIAAHFGGLKPSYMEEMVRFAENNRNVFLNTTGMHKTGHQARIDRDTLTRSTISSDNTAALQEVGSIFVHAAKIAIPNQIIFGDDRGFHTKKELLQKPGYRWPIVLLEPEAQRRIDYTNPRYLFGTRLKQGTEHAKSWANSKNAENNEVEYSLLFLESSINPTHAQRRQCLQVMVGVQKRGR